MRWYSERDYPLGPPTDVGYKVGQFGEPILTLRDQRIWCSVEWAAEHGIEVPENWRDLE